MCASVSVIIIYYKININVHDNNIIDNNNTSNDIYDIIIFQIIIIKMKMEDRQ